MVSLAVRNHGLVGDAPGTDGRWFSWGDEPMPDCCLAAMHSESTVVGCECPLFNTVAVGSVCGDMSVYGVMDMLGNVSEWVSDWYDPFYWRTAESLDRTGPSWGVQRVLRGGNFGRQNPYM